MRILAAVLVALVTGAASAQDFFIGDVGYGPGRSRNITSTALASDGELFYLFADNAMNRLRPDGTIVDGEGFGVENMDSPMSAAYGRGIVVVTHLDAVEYARNYGYATAFRAATGEVLWSQQVAYEGSAVLFDGRDFLVVYRDDYDYEVRVNVLDDHGFVTRTMKIADLDRDSYAGFPMAVHTDRGMLAVWREGDLVRAVAFDASGLIAEPVTVGTGYQRGIGGSLSGSFAVASSGSGALVVWLNSRVPEDLPFVPQIAARHVDATGRPVSNVFEIPVSASPELPYAGSPSAEWDGARYRVLWVARNNTGFDSHVHAAAIAPGSTSPAVEEVTSTGSAFGTSIEVAAGRIVTAWSDWSRGAIRGKSATAESSLAAAEETILRTERHWAMAPAALWTGSHYVVAWSRIRGALTGAEIVMRRFDRNGTPLDAEPRVLATTPWEVELRLASTGSETAVVWSYDGSLHVLRVDAEGKPIDAAPLLVTRQNGSLLGADVASDGRRFVIVWHGRAGVNARRLSARGGFIDAQPINLDDDATGGIVKVVYDGAKFVIGFETGRTVIANTLSSNGTPGEPVVLMVNGADDLLLATSGSTHLFLTGNQHILTDASLGNARTGSGPWLLDGRVVWTGSSFFAAGTANAAWISPAGVVAETPAPGYGYSFAQAAVASAGDGTALLVHTQPSRTFRSTLYGRRVAPRRRAARVE